MDRITRSSSLGSGIGHGPSFTKTDLPLIIYENQITGPLSCPAKDRNMIWFFVRNKIWVRSGSRDFQFSDPGQGRGDLVKGEAWRKKKPRNLVQDLRRKYSPVAAMFRPEKRGGRTVVLRLLKMEALGCWSDAIVNVWQGFGNPLL
ncbi:hypothetical protein U1Q18_002562 [Sarracenia purpurea var. burkii]